MLRLLREDLGYDGVLITDALTMAAIRERWGVPEGAVRALLAGADLLCTDADLATEEAVRVAVGGRRARGTARGRAA